MNTSTVSRNKRWIDRYKPIPPDALPSHVGKPLHLAWACAPGFVWILERVEGEKLFLRTPKNNKKLVANAKDALYTQPQMRQMEAKAS